MINEPVLVQCPICKSRVPLHKHCPACGTKIYETWYEEYEEDSDKEKVEC